MVRAEEFRVPEDHRKLAGAVEMASLDKEVERESEWSVGGEERGEP